MPVTFHQPRLFCNASVDQEVKVEYYNPSTSAPHCLFESCLPTALSAGSIYDTQQHAGAVATFGCFVPAVSSQEELNKYHAKVSFWSDQAFLFIKEEAGLSCLCTTTHLERGFLNATTIKAPSTSGPVAITRDNFKSASLFVTCYDGGMVIIGVLDTP